MLAPHRSSWNPAIMYLTVVTSLGLMIATVWVHAFGLGFLRRSIQRNSITHHLSLASLVSAALVLHIVEICIYAFAIWFLNIVADVGDIVGAREFSAMDYFYYSAETFTGLGSGDLSATSALRLVAAIEPLNGLVLIAWTGAFTYWAMEHFWSKTQD
jgi:Ion channel